MKTTNVTKKEYSKPQFIDMGNAVTATLGTIWWKRDELFGRRLIP
ncbi:hypothetical protein [Anabaena sp. CCY 9402-a]